MSNVKNSLKNGGNAFELAHGEKIWDFYANNNVENNIFVDLFIMRVKLKDFNENLDRI